MAVSWLKTGAASAAVAAQEEAEQEKRKQESGKSWRFFLKEKEEARITFVDGDLINTEGVGPILAPPRYYEHNLQINGKWNNHFVCPEKTSPEEGHKCPICEAGDRPSLVALFTVIDHREYKGKGKDGKEGKVYKDQKRLLVAKPQSMELLQKLAVKRGGLAGCTFDVSRMGDNSAAIGSMFDFVEKNPVADLQKVFIEEVEGKDGKKVTQTYFVPIDYASEIVYRTPEELLKLGLGKAVHTGGPGLNPGGATAGAKPNYGNQL